MSEELDEIIKEFITEAEEILEGLDSKLVSLEASNYDKDLINDIFRGVHTIKGAAGFLGLQRIVDLSHKMENILKKLRDGEIPSSSHIMNAVLKGVDMLKILLKHAEAKDGIEEDISPVLQLLDDALVVSSPLSTDHEPQTTDYGPQTTDHDVGAGFTPAQKEVPQKIQTLRVDIDRMDILMNLVGEIVLSRNRLLSLTSKLLDCYPNDSQVQQLMDIVSFTDRVTTDLQFAVMRIRMQPIQKVFSKFLRLVRDLSAQLGKEVELLVYGEDTEVDKSVIELIGDPMVHIIRNAIDHGIEYPSERETSGKPRKGKITIKAYQKGNHIIIEIIDDGKGIDIEAVKRKALEKGLITAEEFRRINDESAKNLIFSPGFSTARETTELSGRGVGMDVVKNNITKLNGYIEVLTQKGLGTTFTLAIPFTLATIQALMVKVAGETFAVPLAPVVENIRIDPKMLDNVAGQSLITIRGRVYPLINMAEVLNLSTGNDNSKYALLTAVGDKCFCIGVNEILGIQEVVIKSIKDVYTEAEGILGATITGDGKVILIVDLGALSNFSH